MSLSNPSDIFSDPEDNKHESQEPESLTALKQDKWSLRRGQDLLTDSPDMLDVLWPENRLTESDRAALSLLAADFHTAAFYPHPQLVSRCKNPRLRGFLELVMESPGYLEMHRMTRLDNLASESAAVHLARAWMEFKGQEGDEMDIQGLQTASVAVECAVQDAKSLATLKETIRCDPRSLRRAARMIHEDQSLRKIFDMAGRMRYYAQSMQRRKTTHGMDDMVGVEIGGEIGNIVPSELSLLADEHLELDVLRRIAERQVMVRKYASLEPVGKGPVVVVVDESGSMENDWRVQWAKAIALTMLWVARKQNRWCCLIGYSGGFDGNICLCLPDGKIKYSDWEGGEEVQMADGDECSLMAWLSHFYSCGSHCDVPLLEMEDYWGLIHPPAGKTDVIFITDDQAVDSERGEFQAFREWKARTKARLVTLNLNPLRGQLETLSDQYYQVDSDQLHSEGLADIFSI